MQEVFCLFMGILQINTPTYLEKIDDRKNR